MKRNLLSVAVMGALTHGAVIDLRQFAVVEPVPPSEARTRDKSEARRARREQIKRNGGKR